jgi:nicotinamide-nucleotide amidase
MNHEITSHAETVLDLCRGKGLRVATVESCTGGLVCAALTAIAGSSDVVERGFITYTNQSKSELVSVAAALIEAHGAVSEEVARAMAEGGVANSDAEIAVAITGVAGPGGGSEAKPVGLVHLACARAGRPTMHQRHVFPGDRTGVREAAVLVALRMVAEQADEP